MTLESMLGRRNVGRLCTAGCPRREIAPTVLPRTHFQARGSKGQKEFRTMLLPWKEADITSFMSDQLNATVWVQRFLHNMQLPWESCSQYDLCRRFQKHLLSSAKFHTVQNSISAIIIMRLECHRQVAFFEMLQQAALDEYTQFTFNSSASLWTRSTQFGSTFILFRNLLNYIEGITHHPSPYLFHKKHRKQIFQHERVA